MEGWIKLHRQIIDHPDYFSEPFTRIMAWIDLLMLANHRGMNIRVRGNKVEIKRGETAISHENLASRWRWSRGKVKRYLNELEKEQQIIQQKSSIINTISIVNYDEYQSDDTAERTTDDTTSSTADSRQTVQQTDTNKNVKNEKNNISLVSSDEDTMPTAPEIEISSTTKETHPPIPAAPLPNPDPINYQDLVIFFNAETKGVFGMITYPLSEKRRSNVRARIREYGKDSFAKMIRLAARSDFLKGDKGDFKATFDWLIKPSNFQKVLDGNYENRIKSSGTNPQSDERLMQSIAAGYERGLKEREDRGV